MTLDIREYQDRIVIEHPSDPDVQITCEPLSQRDWIVLRKTCTTKKRHKGLLEEEFDPAEFNERTWARCVVDWTGITDGGQPWPCTEANKTAFYKHYWNSVCAYVIDTLTERHRAQGGFSD